MNIYISDDLITLSLAGLRYIRKSDSTYTGMKSTFSLKWAYKGQEESVQYPDKETRDAMYDKVSKALTGDSKLS